MRPNSLLFYFFLAVTILLLIGCNTSKKIQSIEVTEKKPEVVVETKAAIVGGLKALQKELKYPREARENGVEIILNANVLVNKNGEVEQITFDKETEYGFRDAARNALYQVQFRAGERNGEPVNMYVTIPVKFDL